MILEVDVPRPVDDNDDGWIEYIDALWDKYIGNIVWSPNENKFFEITGFDEDDEVVCDEFIDGINYGQQIVVTADKLEEIK